MLRGLVYFLLVFGAGFLLGPVRVLWLVPRVGERLAELLEAPVMLGVIVVAARWVVARFPATRHTTYLGSGILALLLVIAAEVVLVLQLRGLSITEYVSGRDPVSGGVYLCMLAVFALAPWVSARGRGRQPEA